MDHFHYIVYSLFSNLFYLLNFDIFYNKKDRNFILFFTRIVFLFMQILSIYKINGGALKWQKTIRKIKITTIIKIIITIKTITTKIKTIIDNY